jgi:hypothetical protein
VHQLGFMGFGLAAEKSLKIQINSKKPGLGKKN